MSSTGWCVACIACGKLLRAHPRPRIIAQLRLYYDESLAFKRIIEGGAPGEDLLFYPSAGRVARMSKRRPPSPWNAMAEAGGEPLKRKEAVPAAAGGDSEAGGGDDERANPDAADGSDDAAVDSKEAVKCPKFIWLRRALVEFDLFMRVGHLAIFGMVLLFRYAAIISMPDQTVTCDNLLDFFAVA